MTNDNGPLAATSGLPGISGDGHGKKGHRRQESMYAMTGLYSESLPVEDRSAENNGKQSTTESTTAHLCHETVIKCHSRNPSAGFDRDKSTHNSFYETPAVISSGTKECGILNCRPSFIQKYARIKVN